MAVKTRVNFKTDQATAFADNTSGAITPLVLRTQIADLADSATFPTDLADGTNPGLMASADFTKLANIATAATANATNAELRDRTTHTGAQAISTVTGLQTALDGKIDSGDASTLPAKVTPISADEYVMLNSASDPAGAAVRVLASAAPISTAAQAAIDAKAPLQATVGAGLGTTGTVDLDMAELTGTVQTIAATGAITFTTSNRVAGRNVTLVISENGTLSRALTWPAWLVLGAALPTAVSDQTIMVSLLFTGTTDATGIAASATEVA